MIPITPENLEQHGYRLIEWNNGIILEYWKSFRNGNQDFRIGVRFGESRDVPFVVWLSFPNFMYAIKHFAFVEQIEQLLNLLDDGRMAAQASTPELLDALPKLLTGAA